MAHGDGEFDQSDMTSWAKNRGGDAGQGAAAGGGGEEEKEDAEDKGSDPCEILRAASAGVADAISKMEAITLPGDTDSDFSDSWEEVLEDLKAVQEKADDAVEKHEELHDEEDADGEDDDADQEDDEEDEGGGDGAGDGK